MKTTTILTTQWNKIHRLDREIKMFILVTILYGLVYSVRSLFFNFYILSLGFDKEFLGVANSITPAATLVFGLPLGVLTDRIGRRNATILGLAISFVGYGGMLLTNTGWIILGMLFVAGLGETLFFISRAPLLTRLTDRQNRDFIFSLDSALSTFAAVVGSWMAGQMPTWFNSLFGVVPETAQSYRWVIFVGVGLAILAILPNLWIESGKKVLSPEGKIKRKLLGDVQDIMRKPILWKLALPNLVIGLGAALLIPYLNIFFAEVFGISNQLLGSLFSAASLLTGLSVLASPWLARRLGSRIRAVVAAQGISLVFLIATGFSPWLGLAVIGYLGRVALMNMVNPIFSAFMMEQVEDETQGTLNSMLMFTWQIGWAIMPMVSGLIQERYGFRPVFVATGLLYALGIGMIWIFFKDSEANLPAQAALQLN